MIYVIFIIYDGILMLSILICFSWEKPIKEKVYVRLPFCDRHNFINLISNYLQPTKAMERALRPDRFDILPDTPSCEKEFQVFPTNTGKLPCGPTTYGLRQAESSGQSSVSNSVRVYQWGIDIWECCGSSEKDLHETNQRCLWPTCTQYTKTATRGISRQIFARVEITSQTLWLQGSWRQWAQGPIHTRRLHCRYQCIYDKAENSRGWYYKFSRCVREGSVAQPCTKERGIIREHRCIPECYTI